MAYAVGIDIGGTKIAIGMVDDRGVLKTRSVLATNLLIAPEDMMLQVSQEVKRLIRTVGDDAGELLGIGIGGPGPLDVQAGKFTCPPNLPNWVDFPVVAQLARDFSVPIFLQNDANCAALAEKWIGAGRLSNDFVYVTLSTGIGAGIFANGQLLWGSRGNAGDIGHIVIDPAQGECTCGQRGCWEWIASGTAIARRASALLGTRVSAKAVFALFEKGDSRIGALVEETFTYIGIGCVTLINAFDPDLIILGGGVAAVGEPLFRAVRKYIRQYALNPAGRATQVAPAALGTDAGVIGAAALLFH